MDETTQRYVLDVGSGLAASGPMLLLFVRGTISAVSYRTHKGDDCAILESPYANGRYSRASSAGSYVAGYSIDIRCHDSYLSFRDLYDPRCNEDELIRNPFRVLPNFHLITVIPGVIVQPRKISGVHALWIRCKMFWSGNSINLLDTLGAFQCTC
ncbi:hypothetical protein A0H81_14387 [Grifola frondosa]|uniref:Uncharacterized protein n=1 Tax=Grifola frondosa TaxID=5627 RepID=A0A1C7LMW2_GRIFR|nr:hypothetical protein A0H81_14387 [Grifola frondosa]